MDVQELSVERTDDACRVVRSWVGGLTKELPEAVAADVELLTHELVTNAFRHSSTERAWVTAVLLPNSVIMQVTDEGLEGEPGVRENEPYSESGRGLRWVSCIAQAWGVHRRHTTGVWFQIDFPALVSAS
jgi:anti-sigma regulatory factor (Ser/Thr protein kinase)